MTTYGVTIHIRYNCIWFLTFSTYEYLTSWNFVLSLVEIIEKHPDCHDKKVHLHLLQWRTPHFLLVLFINSFQRNQWFSIYQVILFTSASEMKLLGMNRAYLNFRLSIRETYWNTKIHWDNTIGLIFSVDFSSSLGLFYCRSSFYLFVPEKAKNVKNGIWIKY